HSCGALPSLFLCVLYSALHHLYLHSFPTRRSSDLYYEARYVESAAGEAGLEEAVKDMSVGALAYDTVPLSSAGKLDMFSPEFQSLTTDKGAMILHMLRWVEGEAKFDQTMRTFATQYME